MSRIAMTCLYAISIHVWQWWLGWIHRLWSGWPMRGVRIGEAAVPGPATMRILVANVTSWRASWKGLLAAGPDLICAQEARVLAELCEEVASDVGRRGYSLQYRMECDGQHFLAFAHRRGCHVRTCAVPLTVEQMGGRLQYAVVHCGSRCAFHVMQLYGHTDGPSVVALNEELLMAALSWLRSRGDVPALLIVGDFKMSLPGSSSEPLLAMAGWRDVLAEAGPTRLPSSGRLSRIDYVLANRPAMA